jgi:DNA-binding beta-propeller fold protein YncE
LYTLVGLMLVAATLLGCGCGLFDWLAKRSAPASAVANVQTFATGLGKVYGLAFDEAGNLFATGSQGEQSVVWKIDSGGTKAVFATIADPTDVFSALGIANHSRRLANLAVSGKGSIWITSLDHGACFAVPQDKQVMKTYLNSEMSISVRGDIHYYPQGVAWDGDARKLYIITSGPKSAFDLANNVYHIQTLTGDPAQDVRQIQDTGGHTVNVVANDGILLEEPGNGLLAKNSVLYFIGQNALYEVPTNGKLKRVGGESKELTLWGGAIDDSGNIYLSANGKDYEPGSDSRGKGMILRLDAESQRSVFLKDVAQPLGMAFRDGYLYIADRATGSIVRVNVGK